MQETDPWRVNEQVQYFGEQSCPPKVGIEQPDGHGPFNKIIKKLGPPRDGEIMKEKREKRRKEGKKKEKGKIEKRKLKKKKKNEKSNFLMTCGVINIKSVSMDSNITHKQDMKKS